jgi:hypothetical protein
MARHGERQFPARNAATVVADPDELHAAAGELDADLARAGVDAVLDEFLERRRRSIDDFARGDLADEQIGQYLDGRHRSIIPARRACAARDTSQFSLADQACASSVRHRDAHSHAS